MTGEQSGKCFLHLQKFPCLWQGKNYGGFGETGVVGWALLSPLFAYPFQKTIGLFPPNPVFAQLNRPSPS